MNFGNINWDEVEASGQGGDFKRPKADGYVIRITKVEDDVERDKLIITYDIAEGEFAGHYSDEWGEKNPWAHQFFVSYKPSALGLFKQFYTILEDCNNFKWDQRSESMFIGRLMGIVLKEEEYVGNDGTVKTRFSKLVDFKTVEQIRNKDFKRPELKKLDESKRPKATPVADILGADLPF